MNNNLTKGHLQTLRENYEKACNEYINTLLNLWELSPENGWWVGEVGSIYCHEANVSMNMEEIIYCIEHSVSLNTYYQFIDYTEKCDEYNFNRLSLKSFCEGAPRVPQETFDRFDALKQELNKCINDTKSKF